MTYRLGKSFIFLLFLWIFLAPGAQARVYIYEVITAATTFQTASKLPPDAFLMYNGGEDIIYHLKILAVYADKDFEKALRDYGLESKNLRHLPHLSVPNDNISRRPYYWWR